MAALFNQTNINSNLSLYITRAEVIAGLSTLAGDLSGANLSTLFSNPDPSFSTIKMPASGSILSPGSVQANIFAVSTVGRITAGLAGGVSQGVYVADPINNSASLYGKNFIATNAQVSSNADKLQFQYNGIVGLPAAGGTQGLLSWNSAAPAGQNFVLSNVSTINGVPPSGGTTFTTLTGSNLISQIVNTSQLVGVSSFNGGAYQSPLIQTFNGSNNAVVNNATNTSVFSISLPAATLQPNRSYMYDFPIVIGNPPPSPINFQLLIGVRLGGNGQFNYSLPYWIASNSFFPANLNLTGIAQTNTTTVNSQTVEVLMVQNSGGSWTVPVYVPSGSGVVNTLYLKNMSS